MYVGNLDINREWVRLGDKVAITSGKTYTLQNLSKAFDLWVLEKNTDPEVADRGYRVSPSGLFQYMGNGNLWLRSNGNLDVSVGDQ
jgi:hypothetical protein